MSKIKYEKIGDELFRFHVQGVFLCVNGVITEEEHNEFEDWLERVWDRRNAEADERDRA